MSDPVRDKQHYLATLTRDGEVEPFETGWIDAVDVSEAKRLAREWAIPLMSGGLQEKTRLQLVQDGTSVWVKEWSDL